MSLIRTGIVLAVMIAALPSDKGQQQRLYMQTASAIDWAVSYCDRHGETCDKANEYWSIFKAKAEFAGGLALEGMKRYALGDMAAEVPAVAKAGYLNKRGTLSEADLKPKWQGNTRGI